MNTTMSNAHEKAVEFLEHQKAFRLGELLTESSHPKTRRLSQTMQTDVPAGVRLLQAVDEDIPAALERIFAQDSFTQLVEAFREAIRTGRRIFFTGCGATGRLSILLEAVWRRFWREREPHNHGATNVAWASRPCTQDHGQDARATEDRCISVMAGGDFALIKSVEGFEDFPDFGRHQLKEAGVQRNDVVVAITEGGETPFVIGTAWQGLEAGAHVFFVYNNPSDLLRRHVQRSREVIDEPRIHKLDLATGPMAITGSTRMQATTTELLVVGAALETASAQALLDTSDRSKSHAYASVGMAPITGVAPRSLREYQGLFRRLLDQLSSPPAVAAIARMVELEEQVYRNHGLVTYVADSLLLDILTDTTERAPTFMLPPFRKEGDTISPVSWSFVKSAHYPTRQAWTDLLQREPRGLTWGPEVYRQLNAPLLLQASPPKLDNAEIYRFRIGNEADPSRTDAPDSLVVVLRGCLPPAQLRDGRVTAGVAALCRGRPALGPRAEPALSLSKGCPRHEEPSPSPSGLTLPPGAIQSLRSQYKRTAAITFGPVAAPLDVDEHIHIPCDLPASPLRLWEHLAVKLILNTLSTATMVRMGRVIGNAMVWVSPSNKKLIDRGCRLITQQTGCTYEHACEVLHEAIEEIGRRAQAGEEVPSPVALAIECVGTQGGEKAI
jgi:N-acetylmuramic acid 6-phosphate etherase